MRSMTGFGRAQKEFGCDKIGLEISSVNKRNFEVVYRVHESGMHTKFMHQKFSNQK